jgi:RimJ/RimL family protein N-acetyltransferase
VSLTTDLTVDLHLPDLRLRNLEQSDAPLVVEATRHETGPAFWGPRPVGPYPLQDAAAALAAWTPEHRRVSYGMVRDGRLVAVLGLMVDPPEVAELAYWVPPEHRGQGLATRGVGLLTAWAHQVGLARVWLEIEPGNQASLRVAERAGYRLERRLSDHCRSWLHDDPAHDTWHDCLIWSHTGLPTTG